MAKPDVLYRKTKGGKACTKVKEVTAKLRQNQAKYTLHRSGHAIGKAKEVMAAMWQDKVRKEKGREGEARRRHQLCFQTLEP